MAWKGRFSVKEPSRQDLEEIIDDLESQPLRVRRISKLDIPSGTVTSSAIDSAVTTQITDAETTATKANATGDRAEGLAVRGNNPIYMSGSVPAAAANLSDDWSFKRFGLHVGSSISSSGSITVGTASWYLVATSGGDVTITLPAAATCTNMVLGFKKLQAANNMILDPNGDETIDGTATKSFSDRWTFVNIISNGTNWFILSSGVP
tara:strand:+ start:3861 stop:4481 length:621 start_codon:yes stop_codon:yes gene_type:complete